MQLKYDLNTIHTRLKYDSNTIQIWQYDSYLSSGQGRRSDYEATTCANEYKGFANALQLAIANDKAQFYEARCDARLTNQRTRQTTRVS